MNIVPLERALENLEFIKTGIFSHMPEDNVCRRVGRNVVDFDYDAQTITIEFKCEEWMQNAAGYVHGGMQAVCTDQTTGCLAAVLCDSFAATVSLSMSYLRPVPAKGTLVIKAYAVHLGRTNAHLRAELTSKETGELYATATAIHFVKGKTVQEAVKHE